MKSFVQNQLKNVSKRILEQYKPKVIAITGSVGKTSTKNAIAKVLETKYRVRVSPANYNTEFGVPLTIIDEVSPGKSALGWLKVLMKARRLAKGGAGFPEVLVLEFGTDKPGDIDYLCRLATPEISVTTRVSPVHAEHFGTVEALAKEKGQLARTTKADGVVILNADDKLVSAMRDGLSTRVVTYGIKNQANFKGSNYSLLTKPDLLFEPGEVIATGMFALERDGVTREIELNNVIGEPAVYSALAAIAVGEEMNLSMDQIMAGLKNFKSAPGRLKILPGIKGSVLIDDSYNAAPASVMAALKILREFPMVDDNRRVAALGDMLELGQYSEDEHRKIGFQVIESGVDLLVCVGERARDIARAAIEAGLRREQVQEFKNSEEAGRCLDHEVQSGDVVLIKGSQGIRMEKVTKDLMAEPMKAKELLVRQEPPWVE